MGGWAAAGPSPDPHLPGPAQPRGGRDSWWRLKELQDSKEQAAPQVGRSGWAEVDLGR